MTSSRVKILEKDIRKSWEKLFYESNQSLITFETYTIENEILKAFMAIKTSVLSYFEGQETFKLPYLPRVKRFTYTTLDK